MTGRLALWARWDWFCVAGCAGNGWDSTRTVSPLARADARAGPVTADFPVDPRTTVFTPIALRMPYRSRRTGRPATRCDSQHNLLGSTECRKNRLLRVKTGDPHQQLHSAQAQGPAGIVGVKCAGETPLSQATMAAISQWIANGAPMARRPRRRGEFVRGPRTVR